jgi:beta-galactosidase
VGHWGTYITTPRVTEQSAAVVVRTRIRNDGERAATCTLETSIPGARAARIPASVPAGETREFTQEFTVAGPRLWSPETPFLYDARTNLLTDGRVVDTCTTPFGIREIRFDAGQGLLVNGRSVKMKGVCLHHDAGCLGAAVPDAALERRLRILKSIGCNAIRTSHNPPAPELLDLADRTGFLVIDEAFDKWGGHTNPEFAEWWERDLRAMLERDRNHPSIVLWSVGNETGRPGSGEVNDTLRKLVEFVHREEPTRPVICALAPLSGSASAEEKARAMADSAGLMDVAALNYSEQWYERVHELLPGKVVVGTESYPYYRGDGNTHKAYLAVNPWYDVARHPYVAGQFLWSGIDYLGESSGWPSKGWPTGLIDTCGFIKPAAYFHQSVWKPDEPLVRIAVLNDGLDIDPGKLQWGFPKMAEHWNWPRYKNDTVRVATTTNCETVELLVNGQSLGVRKAADYGNSTILWTVPYEPGRIEAVGRNGNTVAARHELRTSAAPAAIALLPDRGGMRAGGQDLVHVEVRLLDAAGTLVPDSDRLVSFALSGPAALAGVDNGDMRSAEPYQGQSRTTYFGRALVIVRAQSSPGTVTLTATAPGLTPVSAKLQVEP